MVIAEAIGILPVFRKELSEELCDILDYWMNHSQDQKHGGFIGSLDNKNSIDFAGTKRSGAQQPDTLDIFGCLPLDEKAGIS